MSEKWALLNHFSFYDIAITHCRMLILEWWNIDRRVFGDNMIMIIEWIEMSCFSCIRVMIYIDKFTF